MKRLNAFIERKFLRAVGEDVRLSALWAGLAPPDLVSHFRPVAYTHGQLTLHADSPVWASRLRHQQQAIRDRLKSDPYFQDLVKLTVRAVPHGAGDLGVPAVPRCQAKRFSRLTATLLGQVAQGETDPELRAALERLAKTAAARTK
ncbi:MAG: DciA family protein [Gammaproteobacteria bacterium]